MCDWLAQELKLPAGTVKPTDSFFDYGLDSVTVIMLTASLEDWLGCSLIPEIAYDYPVISALAQQVVRHATASSDTTSD